MNKKKFLSDLRKELSILDKSERDEYIEFYNERFDYEESDEKVIASLESPERIAKVILNDHGINTEQRYIRNNKPSVASIIGIIILDILVIFPIYISLLSVPFSLLLISICSLVGVFGFIDGFLTGISATTLGFGMSIITLIIGVLALNFCIYLGKHILKWNLDAFGIKFSITKNIKFKKSFSKPLLWILSVMGICLLLTGTIFSIIAISSTGKTQILTEEKIFQNVKNINIDVKEKDVRIIKVSSPDVKIKYVYREDGTYTFEQIGNSITLKENYDFFNYFDYWNFNDLLSLGEKMVIIEIPEDLVLENLIINTSNSRVNLSEIEVSNKLKIDTSNSSLSLSDITTDEFIIDTSNGKVMLNNITSTSIQVDTSNGKITLNNITSNDILVDTSNADINFDTVHANNVTIDTSNRNVDLKDVFTKRINIDTSNGNISYENPSDRDYVVDYIWADTSNGHFNITVKHTELVKR